MSDTKIEITANQPEQRELRYEPQCIEEKWHARWESDPALYAAEPHTSQRKKYYVLEMLPYPSGALHMGHVRNYAIGDALARFMWMSGYNVLHPMGWDAFGLPAENAAIKNNVPPKEWTLRNIAHMKSQMKRLGFAYDWSREVATCLPEYYKWNQWFFLKLYEKGLAYRKKSRVNWCPECATVLANEQVVDGCCWRHEETQVETRDLEQWFVRTTNYSDELLAGLDKLEGWPEKVRTMQRNWIGRSEGALVDFKIDGPLSAAGKITVFTTRIDTIFGATSIQLAPEHPIVAELVGNDPHLHSKVEDLVREQNRARESGDVGAIEKHGVFTGRYAINPFNQEKVPIWVANYILLDYGTGAIMSVPAHDERDYEFAEKYGLEARIVILPRRIGQPPAPGEPERPVLPYTEKDSLLINSGQFSELSNQEAIEKMTAYAESGGFGKRTVTYRLKDWGISRQRYWGTPIPMLYCEQCGVLPVPEKDLPVVLPDNVDITLQGGSPLGRVPEFVNAKCPKCGGVARRETDTMDTFVDSSWYFYRYTNAHLADRPLDTATVDYWFPIDQYIGGVEHAILHLIYSRFWTKFLRDLGIVHNDEPATRLFTQGMVIKDGAKMSKSRGNVVSPDEMVARFGADSTRMYALFATSPDRELDWQEAGVEGVHRFLSRAYRFVMKHKNPMPRKEWEFLLEMEYPPGAGRDIHRKLHKTLKRVSQDFSGRWHFNTSVALIMELVNELYITVDGEMWSKEKLIGSIKQLDGTALPFRHGALLQGILVRLTQMLHPFAPYVAHEMWEMLGETTPLLREPWPAYDPALAKEDEITYAVQVNGKLRSHIVFRADAPEDAVRERVLADEKVRASTDGKQVVKVIVVAGKLVNVVVR